MPKRKVLLLSLGVFLVGVVVATGAIPNWAAPATWTPPRQGGVRTLSETLPLPFQAVTPCRVADTRAGSGFVGAYGPPSIPQGTSRTMTMTGVCGIAAYAGAVSINITITNITNLGDVRVFPAGGSAVVSTQNWTGGTGTIANAAVVQLGSGGAVTFTIDGFAPVDLVVDVNGYYADTNTTNFLPSSEFFNIVGSYNVFGFGGGVLFAESMSTLGAPTAGVRGFLSSGGSGLHAAGVRGEATATTGRTNGVIGITSSGSNTAAGVFGSAASVSVPEPANLTGATGVWGEGHNGVVGVTVVPGGECATYGLLVDTAGTLGQFGCLGDVFTGKAVEALGDYGGTGAKYFMEAHPTDPSKEIDYVALEGGEAGTYFRGTAETVGREFVIQVPEDFRLVTDTDGLTVQLTPVGAPATMYVVSEDLNQIVVRSSRDVTFHYLVNGVRASFKNLVPIRDVSIYMPRSPDSRMPAGLATEQKRRLIANGTYNADGTVNMDTAVKVGWAKIWQDRAAAQEAAAKAAAAAKPNDPQVHQQP